MSPSGTPVIHGEIGMMDRRDILKLFGIGAAVVPLVGGVPDFDASASLIEIPRIEPLVIPATPFKDAFLRAGERVIITVDVVTPHGRARFRADSILLNYLRGEYAAQVGVGSQVVPRPGETIWRLEGLTKDSLIR